MTNNVDISGGSDEKEMIERSSHVSNSNRKSGYLKPNAKKIFI